MFNFFLLRRETWWECVVWGNTLEFSNLLILQLDGSQRETMYFMRKEPKGMGSYSTTVLIILVLCAKMLLNV